MSAHWVYNSAFFAAFAAFRALCIRVVDGSVTTRPQLSVLTAASCGSSAASESARGREPEQSIPPARPDLRPPPPPAPAPKKGFSPSLGTTVAIIVATFIGIGVVVSAATDSGSDGGSDSSGDALIERTCDIARDISAAVSDGVDTIPEARDRFKDLLDGYGEAAPPDIAGPLPQIVGSLTTGETTQLQVAVDDLDSACAAHGAYVSVGTHDPQRRL